MWGVFLALNICSSQAIEETVEDVLSQIFLETKFQLYVSNPGHPLTGTNLLDILGRSFTCPWVFESLEYPCCSGWYSGCTDCGHINCQRVDSLIFRGYWIYSPLTKLLKNETNSRRYIETEKF